MKKFTKVLWRLTIALGLAAAVYIPLNKGKIGNLGLFEKEYDLPPLRVLKYTPLKGGLLINDRGKLIQIAVEIEKGLDDGDLTADIIDLYQWGEKTMPTATIQIVFVDDIVTILTPDGIKAGYAAVIDVQLSSSKVEEFLGSKPENFDELTLFWQTANGNGGQVEVYDPPILFEGFK